MTEYILEPMTLDDVMHRLREAGYHISKDFITLGLERGVLDFGRTVRREESCRSEIIVFRHDLENWIAKHGTPVETES